jgi:microcompartment protein CcmK/EutM
VLKTSVVGKVIAGIMEIVVVSMGQAARMMKN